MTLWPKILIIRRKFLNESRILLFSCHLKNKFRVYLGLRYNVKSTDHKHFSFEFQAKDLSCSSSNTRTATALPGAPPPPPPPHIPGAPPSAATKSLQRSRKPPPLKYLQSAAVDCQPPVQTPWTPLAASPVIEESFKKIVQQQNAKVLIFLPILRANFA